MLRSLTILATVALAASQARGEPHPVHEVRVSVAGAYLNTGALGRSLAAQVTFTRGIPLAVGLTGTAAAAIDERDWFAQAGAIVCRLGERASMCGTLTAATLGGEHDHAREVFPMLGARLSVTVLRRGPTSLDAFVEGQMSLSRVTTTRRGTDTGNSFALLPAGAAGFSVAWTF